MKRITLTICTLLTLSSFTQLNAQSDAEMKKWMDYMTPGETHKMIAKSDGDWNAELTMWMGPNMPPSKTTGTCTNTMILGGRYQQSKYSADINGMAFEGISTLAYDNALKKFISTWIDNMGTGIIMLEGVWDNTSKSLTLKGKTTDPSTYKEMDMREVFKIVDDNTQVMEIYNTTAGKEYKSMEIKLTRKI
ncbi:MAG: DUF1579 domain-containing protein [Bacteroidetes bacterium]|nr:DUF1579 domain-containing protein [Bacteroidota bacterium]